MNTYFAKRVGWHWEIWFTRENSWGPVEYRALPGVHFWRRLIANRVALACQQAHSEGYYLDEVFRGTAKRT